MSPKYSLRSRESHDSKTYCVTISCEGLIVIEFEKVKSGISNSVNYKFFIKTNKDNILEDWLVYHEFENIRTRFFNLNTRKAYESVSEDSPIVDKLYSLGYNSLSERLSLSTLVPGNYEISPSGIILTSIANNIITFHEFLNPEEHKNFINPLKCEIELTDDYYAKWGMKDNDIFEHTTYRLRSNLKNRFLTDEEIKVFHAYYFDGPPNNDIYGDDCQLKPYSRIQLQRKGDVMCVISNTTLH